MPTLCDELQEGCFQVEKDAAVTWEARVVITAARPVHVWAAVPVLFARIAPGGGGSSAGNTHDDKQGEETQTERK